MINKENKTSLPPFSCNYTPEVPRLIKNLNCTIALSTYQAGKIVFISAKDENRLIQLPRNFDKAMGIAEDTNSDKLAVARRDEVIVFKNSKELAYHYPKSPKKYDALYVPRNTFYTGSVDIHDLNFGEREKIYAVNTLFSSIVNIDDNYSFTPYWTPFFIDKIAPEDRCHLNGMAMYNGRPKYATAFNQGNTKQSWREKITETGVVLDIEENKVICEKLAMPHSPRIFNNELYVLLSATGELVKINPETGNRETIIKIKGFVRGMSYHKEYLFIGTSKLRKNSSTFSKLPFAKEAQEAGVTIVHLPTKSVLGKITYLNSLDEIYDVHILANKQRPNILNTKSETYKDGIDLPKTSFWRKSEQ